MDTDDIIQLAAIICAAYAFVLLFQNLIVGI